MPRAAQSTYCTINDAAVPSLCSLARISGHPNACHHPPETSYGEAETLVLGRVNDVVGRQDLRPVWHLLLVQVMQVH